MAFDLASPELEVVRRRLAGEWWPWLGAQDRQLRFRPHFTVQNKVSPQEARALHGHLAGEFSPFEVEGEGLSLWRYVGGPWRPVGTYPFQG